MNSKFLIIQILLISLSLSRASAQGFEPEKGKAVIYFQSNTGVIVRLDTALIHQTKLPINLKAGKYVIKAWAPTKRLFIDTITIRENRTTLLARRLKNSEAYTKHREAIAIYKFEKVVTTFLPLPLTMTYSIIMASRYNDNKKQMNGFLADARTSAISYSQPLSVSDLARYKQEYDSERNSYEACRNKNNRIVKTTAISVSLALVASASLLYLSSRLVKPQVYTETPLLTLNSILLRSDYPSTASVGLIININN